MANLYYDVRVDIQKDIVIDSGLRFTQGDSKVIYLRIAVMNGGVEFDASNTTPSVNFVKPDGTYVVGTPVKSGSFWIYQILGNELQKAGKVLCDIKFTYESGRVSSSKFTFIVEKDTTISGAEASSSYVTPMEELLGEMQNYKNQGYSLAEAAEKASANATTEADRAKDEADRAAAVVGIDIATTTQAGIVKIPTDGSITIDSDGTIHSSGGSTADFMKVDDYDSNHDGIVDEADHANSADVAANALTATDSMYANNLKDNQGNTISTDDVLNKLSIQIPSASISGDTATFTDAKIGGSDMYLASVYCSDLDRYIKSRSVSGNTLTVTFDDSIVGTTCVLQLYRKE